MPLERLREPGLYAGATGKGAILACCTSTFEALASLQNFQNFTVWDWVMACYQTKGRGQYGRQWQSPLGNLCVSQVLPPFRFQPLLAMLLAAVMVHVLNRRGVAVALKWPNDIILDMRKVGGLLLEQRHNSLVLGLGLNFAAEPLLDEQNVLLPALPPGTLSPPDNLLEFWQDCSRELQIAWQRWREIPETGWRQEIESVMAFRGSRVEFWEWDSSGKLCRLEGCVEGLSPCGALILETANGKESKLRGSLRPYFCSSSRSSFS